MSAKCQPYVATLASTGSSSITHASDKGITSMLGSNKQDDNAGYDTLPGPPPRQPVAGYWAVGGRGAGGCGALRGAFSQCAGPSLAYGPASLSVLSDHKSMVE